MAARQQRSAAIVAELFNLWEMELPRISGKSKLAEAVRYATSRRKVLECFLIDSRVEIDSNIVERAIRPQTITRKNALFAGSDGGGRTSATIATLPQTAKMNDVDPLTWLALTLQRIANGWPISQIQKTYAVELQDLNGLCLALTDIPRVSRHVSKVANSGLCAAAIPRLPSAEAGRHQKSVAWPGRLPDSPSV